MTFPRLRSTRKKRGLENTNLESKFQSTNTGKKESEDNCINRGKHMEKKTKNISGLLTIEGTASCPCCNCKLKGGRQTVGDTRPRFIQDSLFKDDGSDTESSRSSNDLDEQDCMMPGVLSGGVSYTVTRDLVQGWVHKKGTGTDWLGSRAWKPRWAVLSLARISGHEVEVPLLQVFWHSTSPTPSTVIHLDSAVVVPETLADRSQWNCFRFQIRHVKKSLDDETIQITRIFSCPQAGRDAWCQAINEALLSYEKERARARRQSGYLSLSPPRWRSIIPWVVGDTHPSKAKNSAKPRSSSISNPMSPPRNIPRHEHSLIGEVLLGQSKD